MVWQRPASYEERRSDGYREPELVFIVGTAHVSRQSALDVQRVIEVRSGPLGVGLRGEEAIRGGTG